ncbi:hypothetical protein [Clostridium sp.]
MENNITKAFINTFGTLSNKGKCATLNDIAKIDLLPDSGIIILDTSVYENSI